MQKVYILTVDYTEEPPEDSGAVTAALCDAIALAVNAEAFPGANLVNKVVVYPATDPYSDAWEEWNFRLPRQENEANHAL